MSKGNAEVVAAAYAAFSSGGVERFIEHWADGVDHRAVEGALDDRGPIRSKDALRAYLDDWVETFDDFKVEPVELIDAGRDQVVGVVRLSGRAKLSGVETNLTFAILHSVRGGKLVRGREYWTREEAREAAGLSD